MRIGDVSTTAAATVAPEAASPKPLAITVDLSRAPEPSVPTVTATVVSEDPESPAPPKPKMVKMKSRDRVVASFKSRPKYRHDEDWNPCLKRMAKYAFWGILQCSPHIAAIAIYVLRGDLLCSERLAGWLAGVGGYGLAVHLLILIILYANLGGKRTIALGVVGCVFLVAFLICTWLLIEASFDLEAFDPVHFANITASTTMCAAGKPTCYLEVPGTPPAPTAANVSMAGALAWNAEACVAEDAWRNENIALGEAVEWSRTSPCTYVPHMTCEPGLFWPVRGIAVFWLVIEMLLVGGGGGALGL